MNISAVIAFGKVRTLSPQVWVHLCIVVLAVLLTVALIRQVVQMNKMLLSTLVFVVGSLFFFQWIYERNEPAFLTAAIDRLAPYFPAKDNYVRRQGQDPGEAPRFYHGHPRA